MGKFFSLQISRVNFPRRAKSNIGRPERNKTASAAGQLFSNPDGVFASNRDWHR
jgi:hypothetical protein